MTDTQRDLRSTPLYQVVESFYSALHAPGRGCITDACDVAVCPDGDRIAFTGIVFDDLAHAPRTQLCEIRLLDAGRSTRAIPAQHSDRLPRWSPDGQLLAFLSDREEAGHFRLYVRRNDGAVRAMPVVDGLIESIAWSSDGKQILLGFAGSGADLAGCQGGAKTPRKRESLPPWVPDVDTGDAEQLWRGAAILDLASGELRIIRPHKTNLWEVAWLGPDRLIAVVSDSHSEGSWYQAELAIVELRDQQVRKIYQPRDQIAVPTASPAGDVVAFIAGVASDRMILYGGLMLIDTRTGATQGLDTDGVEVTQAIWRDPSQLVFTGHRGLETVIGEVDVGTGISRSRWSSLELTFGTWNPGIALSRDGTAVVVGEGYATPPEIASIDGQGRYCRLMSVATPETSAPEFNPARIEPVEWRGRDDLLLQGWIIRPPGAGPWPLVMDIHGGPVWMCRNRWQGRLRGAKVLADHGIASFYPNPRGSAGRGREFALRVRGDMGGEDTFDFLTGVDALVDRGIADAAHLGVTGISYGGYMSAWLITQDRRFAAAAPISVVADWYSQHRTSQIPYFDALFLDGEPAKPGGLFHARSPAFFADRVTTPTLQLTGALDQNTPPTQALEFHRSLLENKVRSILVTYPTAGHGIRGFPEVIDATTRYVAWFLEYLKKRS
jgi:dipeptidyl aminopeptidase/acylaminoacyl peptidase